MFVKPAKTYPEQLTQLKDRGLVVIDNEYALSVLQRVNYYRLTGYLLAYKNSDDTYVSGTTFEHVFKVYQFDADLRNLLVRILESIEITIRTKISYYLAHAVSPLAHRYRKNFRDINRYLKFRKDIKREMKSRKNKDAVVTHHFKKYKGRFPIWVSVEYMSFGQLSVFYSNLTDPHQRSIANSLGLTAKLLRSWLHSLVYFRNLCAHYSRIYGRNVTFPPILPPDRLRLHGNTNLFAILYVCSRLCESRSEWVRFLTSLEALFDIYGTDIDISTMGFVDTWFGDLKRVQTTHSNVK